MKTNGSKLIRFFGYRYLKRSALQVWVESRGNVRLSAQETLAVLDTSWEKYQTKAVDIPQQANPGNWLVMHFAYLTLSAYQALLGYGLEQSVSVDLMSELTWSITSTWTKRGQRFSKLFFHDQPSQLDFFVDFIMGTLFSRPGYQFERGNTEVGSFLNVHKCPVAEFMISNDASDLCIQAWCGVDSGLVEILGGSLKRSGTIAMGKTKCDFVFLPPV